jgi:probable F420-dependent oxidoreductase
MSTVWSDRRVAYCAAVSPQLSLILVTFASDDPQGWEGVVRRACAADQAGVDRLVVSDHVVFGEHLEAYGRPELGGTEGGTQPTGPDGHWLEPLTTLAFIGARTSRIRLGTNILLAALRRPVVLAKTAATLDVLCGGRLDLGAGVGWQREEYEAAGLDFDDRGALLDETLAVCTALWRDVRAEHHGPRLDFEGIHMMPKPLQGGGVPIWIGGTVNRRVARRLARFGCRWIPWGPAARDVVGSIEGMRVALEREGGDPRGLQVVGMLPIARDCNGGIDLPRTMAAVPALRAAGVTDFRTTLRVPDDAAAAFDLLAPLVAAFRTAIQ